MVETLLELIEIDTNKDLKVLFKKEFKLFWL